MKKLTLSFVMVSLVALPSVGCKKLGDAAVAATASPKPSSTPSSTPGGAAACSATAESYAQTDSSGGDWYGFTLAQAYTPAATVAVASLQLYMRNSVTSNTSVKVDLYSDGGAGPDSGTLLATSTVSGASLNTGALRDWITFPFASHPQLVGGQKYFVIVTPTIAGGDQIVEVTSALQGGMQYYAGGWYTYGSYEISFKVLGCQ